MAELAEEFNLHFSSDLPSTNLFNLQLTELKKDWRIIEVIGNIKEHSIQIYDIIFPGSSAPEAVMNYDKRMTVVIIDKKYIKGGEESFESFKISDNYFTSIFELRRILRKLQ